jgi:hypothetical protein
MSLDPRIFLGPHLCFSATPGLHCGSAQFVLSEEELRRLAEVRVK